MTSTQPRTGRPLVWFLWLQGLLLAATVGCAAADLDTAGRVTSGLIVALAPLAVVGGIRLHRPVRPVAWWLLVVSQVAFLVGAIAFTVFSGFPGPADAIYLVVQYPAMIGALVLFIRARSPGRHRATLIDAAVVATGAALASWIYVLHPATEAFGAGPTGGLLVGMSYPVIDLLLLVVTVRLSLDGGRHHPSNALLTSSFVIWLGSDTLYLLERVADIFTADTSTTFGYLTAGVLLGAAALHPSMTKLAERVDAPPPEPTPVRLALLATAALIAPAILVVEHLRGTPQDVLVIAAACAVLFLLVFARMSGLVATQRRQAVTDPLTGLYTRRFFVPALAVEVARSGRSRVPLGLLLLDIDHFKRINDGFGHPVGDAVLQTVAARLAAHFRSGDIVVRYGGEEFAVLVPGAGTERVAELAETVRRSMTEPVPIGDGQDVAVTVSIGTATVPADAGSPEDVVRLADAALYAAKHGGRNRVVAASTARAPVPV